MDIINKIIKNWKNILIFLLTIICIILVLFSNCSNQKNKVLTNNILSLRDSVEVIQLQNGNLLSEKQSLILDNQQLSDYLELSNKEIRDLQKKLDSKLLYISELEGNVSVHTVVCHDSVYITDSVHYVDFSYSDDWINLYGTTDLTIPLTTIRDLSISTPLTVGITEDYKFFVTSPNPYLNITNINSAVVESKTTKPKHWNLGIQVGVGVNYDLIKRQFGVGPYVGVGLSYGFCF